MSLKLPKTKIVKEAEQQVANLKSSIDLMSKVIELAAISDKHALELQKWINSLLVDGQQFIHQCGLNQYPDYHDAALLLHSQDTRWSLPKAVEVWSEFHINWIRYIHRSKYLIINKSRIDDQPYLVDRLSKIQHDLELKKKMTNWTLIEEKTVGNSLTENQLDYIENKVLTEIKDFYER